MQPDGACAPLVDFFRNFVRRSWQQCYHKPDYKHILKPITRLNTFKMSDSVECVKVAVPLPVQGTFTYAVPDELSGSLVPGMRVLVPFGPRTITGYVMGHALEKNIEGIKEITDAIDEIPVFPPEMAGFFEWISSYYVHPVGEVIETALPKGINVSDRAVVRALISFEEAGSVAEKRLLEAVSDKACDRNRLVGDGLATHSLLCSMQKKGMIAISRELVKPRTGHRMQKYVFAEDVQVQDDLTSAQKRAFEALSGTGQIRLSEAKHIEGISDSLIKSLKSMGLVRIEEMPEYRDPFGDPVLPDTPPELNQDQAAAVRSIVESAGKGFGVFLLKGVTGSGKTEVYMRAVKDVLDSSGSAIVLVPEIALISQTERRFRSRFGERIAVLHSGMSDGERFDQWMRIRNGDVRVVIGARSAIFAPLEKPSLIIVDEEHDDSYKQDSGLRYNARDLAVVRGRMCGSCVVLGSATPSLQTMFNVKSKRFGLLEMNSRVNDMPLPQVRMVDLRAFDKNDPESMISPVLEEAIRETLDRGEQVLIFINRRGHSPFLMCEACGEAVKCRNCDISLTFHQKSRAFKCHFCGFVKPSVSRCEACGSSRIKRLGTGAEKVEEKVRKLFPLARIDRMDQDTTRTKGSVVKILKKLRERETDILVGTQMVVKGHDFPGITLVGIICADLSLNFPDFRAGERTFQILSQVAGRAGRGDIPGRVIMQTYNPVHYAISVARDQDYDSFYRQETSFRKSLEYPPYTRIAQIRIWGSNEVEVEKQATLAGERCMFLQGDNREFIRDIIILGPVEASLYRMASNFRWQILVKAKSPTVLNSFMRTVMADPVFSKVKHGVRISADIDPYFMM